jgi:hypothetical protein
VSRAVSTVVDVSLAILLVSAAAVALVSIPSDAPEPPDPDATARTVLASTVTVSAGQDGDRVTAGRLSTLLAHAAVAADRDADPAFVAAVKRAVAGVLEAAGPRVELVATAGDATLRVGSRPPPDAAVAATTQPVPTDETTVAVTVRTWLP